MFLTEADLTTHIVNEVKEYLTSDSKAKFSLIVRESIALVEGYLAHKYDTELIFSQKGRNRNLLILKILKAIVSYELYASLGRDRPNEIISTRHEEALRWLEKVNTGEFKDSLPLKSIEEQTTPSYLNLGSNKNYRSSF